MGKMMMSSAILLSIFLFIDLSVICCYEKVVNTTFGCITRERKALLKFRDNFWNPFPTLSSWNDDTKDCCTWQGIGCDKLTGHVTRLDLGYKSLLHSDNSLQGQMIDPSLLELKHLSYLDLSGINFQLSPIPAFLGSMTQLRHLNLSGALLSGVVPHDLGNLSSLNVLDLGGAETLDDIPPVVVDDLMWVSRLSLLENLNMSYVDLSPTKDLLKVLNMLPSLVVLSMSSSKLINTNLQHACINSSLSNVQHLDLSHNFFFGELPLFLHNMSSLRHLDLSHNNYSSSGLDLRILRSLVQINLGWNSLNHNVDWISGFISNKCHLKSLYLSLNQFYGEISTLFQNLSGCWRHNLETLDLSSNKFYGRLPEELGGLKKLMYLDLSYNAINGSIPSSLGNLSALRTMDLFGNQLSGPIPSCLGNLRELSLGGDNSQLSGRIPLSLGQLSNLEILYLGSTSLDGTLCEAHFAKLSKLKILVLFSLKFRVGFDWVPPFQLEDLEMQSCDIECHFPQWLQLQQELVFLFLINCSISEALPNWFHYMNLTGLILSQNHIQGPLPNNIGRMLPSLQFLFLDENYIIGSIPDSLCEMKYLIVLDLSKNQLSGNLLDCWGNFQQLFVLKLSSNKISGFIPNSIGGAYSLEWLHLNNNSLTGKLPSTLRNCSRLILIDIGENILSGKLPKWIGEYLIQLRVLRLRENEFYGPIPSGFCKSPNLQVLDLASNNLSKRIPHCIGNFSNMVEELPSNTFFFLAFEDSLMEVLKGLKLEYSTRSMMSVAILDLSNNNLVGEIPELKNLSSLIGLNLSHNHLEGKIPERVGDLTSIESLDLSNNNLFGSIPNSLSYLTFLSHLNLSHNNLSGRIPTGSQLQTLVDLSIYEDNPQLCGAPLPKKCGADKASEGPNVKNHLKEDEEDNVDKVLFYGFIVSGFAIGFWGVIGALVFKRSWRHAYFEFVEDRIGTWFVRKCM
ncbi:hypothetical protein RD792_003646 [Penstemon davidsonii]|uniref:Leucine-rich repeat-containing N-terminal plant-type domain-containing protein n=1 Tax=Penstemon davidsonii TaxID=160366 RepID=A0ABR0DF91_9LAMI|nr:hypothetical protein RD792_003646 [Penstemon davidsonii]